MSIKRSLFIGLLLLLLLPISVFSQVAASSNQVKIDSLNKVLNGLDENEERIEVLNELARFYFYDGSASKAFLALREARYLSEDLDSRKGIRLYYLSLAVFHGTSDMAPYYQKKAEWLSERSDREPLTYTAYSQDNSEEPYQPEEVIRLFESALSNLDKEKDKELWANILAMIAYQYFRLDQLERAYNSLTESVILFAEIDELFPVILQSRYRISLLNFLGREDEARKIELYLVDLVAKSSNTNRLYYITSAMGDNYSNTGRFALAIEYYLKSLEEAERVGDIDLLISIQLDLGAAYESLGLNNKAVEHYLDAIADLKNSEDSISLSYARGVVVFPLIALKDYEQARHYMDLVIRDTINYPGDSERMSYNLARYYDASGQLLMGQEEYGKAIPYFEKASYYFEGLQGFEWGLPFIKMYLTECHLRIGELNTSLSYGLECLEMTDESRVVSKVSLLVSETYEQMYNLPLAHQYLQQHVDIRTETERLDELNRISDAEIRSVIDKSQNQINELEQERIRNEQESKTQRVWIFSIAGALISAILLAIILYRNNKAKQKTNVQLEMQKADLQNAMDKLSATQNQLIHTEKMASLGELTAGIAHEIQNPLNFVNNFSEINNELVEELLEELRTGEIEEARTIAQNILDNEGKILHHGKRAEGIVKGMLQHSRSSSGEKELTDLNVLADEYLRLSYHGLRAKDKSFNAEYIAELDDSIPKINVVAQDIGRVLLNLINNAFYAVREVKSAKVVVTTKRKESQIEIAVTDNGPGIPDEIRDKIFQPFFTTKRTGEGTGLGLSLSYDIITKGHGGELKMSTDNDQGTTFFVILPVA